MKQLDNKKLEILINDTYEYFKQNIPKYYIERDYYMTLKIKELMLKSENLALKGGMALSKAYEKLPIRDSRDIDLTAIDGSDFNNDKQKLNIQQNEQSYIHCNPIKFESVSGRKFNPKINVSITYKPDSTSINKIKIVTLIGKYLYDSGLEDEAIKMGLQSFIAKVECPERIFVDKVYALCQRYRDCTEGFMKNGNKIFLLFEDSCRHLIDLYILNKMHLNMSPSFLVTIKNKIFKNKRQNLIESNSSVSSMLKEIASSELLKNDFMQFSKNKLFDDEIKNKFDELKQNLVDIANSSIFK